MTPKKKKKKKLGYCSMVYNHKLTMVLTKVSGCTNQVNHGICKTVVIFNNIGLIFLNNYFQSSNLIG